MPSTCTNGVFSPEQNCSKKAATRVSVNNRFRGSQEPHYQNNNKSGRGAKYTRSRTQNESSHSSNTDVIQSGASRQSTKSHFSPSQLSTSQSQMDGMPVDVGSTMDCRYTVTPPGRMTVAQQIDPTSNTTECFAFANTGQTVNTSANHMYDSPNHGYVANVSGYMPGIPCAIPNCTRSYSSVNPLAYGPGFVPGPVYPDPNATVAGCPIGTPYYVLVNSDSDVEKHMYQTQWAMSNLNLNSSLASSVPAEYAVGVPVFQPPGTDAVSSANGVAHDPSFAYNVPTTTSSQPMDQSCSSVVAQNQSVAHTPTFIASTAESTPALLKTNNGVTDTNSACITQPCFVSVSTAGHSLGTSDGFARPVPADVFPNSTPSAVSVGASPMNIVTSNDAMWTANNCYGPNQWWFPQTYTNYNQPYYQPVSVPVASISPNHLLNLGDSSFPNIADRYRTPAYSINDESAASAQDYLPGPNVSVAQAYANAVRVTMPQSALQPTFAGSTQPNTVYPTSPMGPTSLQSSQWLNATRWQLLLNTLTASKYAAGGILNNHPFTPHSIDRRRTVPGTNVPVLSSNVFDAGDLASLNFTINPIQFDKSLLYRTRFFVIKSDCDYNVRQSIQHGVWCSTRAGNQCLEEAFQSVQATVRPFDHHTIESTDVASVVPLSNNEPLPHPAGHVLLFFSVRSSGFLNGVAEMIGPVNTEKRVPIWEDPRFKGEIPIRWIYVKNVPNNLIKHICVEAYENRPVTALRDTSEIRPANKGEELLRIVHNYGLAQPSSVSAD